VEGGRERVLTSPPATANAPGNISPVGPPPVITTTCAVIGTLPSASRRAMLGSAASGEMSGQEDRERKR
jgi:hypothetical protein